MRSPRERWGQELRRPRRRPPHLCLSELSSPEPEYTLKLLRHLASLVIAQQRRTYDRVVLAPLEMPSRRNAVITILVIQASGGCFATCYTWLRGTGSPGPFPWAELMTLNLGMLVVTLLWSLVCTQAMGQVARSMAEGADPERLPAPLLRAALRQHRPLSLMMLIQWVIFGVALGLILGRHTTDDPTLWSFTAVTTLLYASMMPVLVRYELLGRIGFAMTSAMLPSGLLDPLGEIPRIRVYQHIYLLLGLLGVVLPLTLVVLARDPQVSNLLIGLLISDLVVVGIYLGSRTLRLISLPVGYLESQMDAVRGGRLDLRARLFAVDTFGALTSDFNAMIEGLRQRERIREIFGRYVTRQIAEEILNGRVVMGGERRTATVIFADIRGFTGLAEQMPPEEVLALLNRYLGAMVRCVLDEGGVLDKFIGDAIMALFGVPLSAGDPQQDARAAMRAALKMSEELDRLNAERIDQGLIAVELGIGLHTGDVVAGNIGIPERMEYTVIGDTVNVSARLEGLTRTLGHRIVLSAETAALVSDLAPLVRVDTVHVRGRVAPITVFTTEPRAEA